MIITSKKRAFSLLEMMVVLAIVLILSMMIYPALNNYLVQSKVADALVATSPIQTMVANQIASLGSVSGSGDNLSTPASLSRFISAYSVASDGVISVTTTSEAGGISFNLTPSYDATNEQVGWTCAVSDSSMNNSVPSKCRI